MDSAVVHAHFYQPPRENPWLNEVEAELGAAPFANWNERIAHECYGPFAVARLLDGAGHVVDKINLYEWVSYDVAPTLMVWLERHAAATYEAILAADRASSARLDGHGNAIASPYNHIILPLASYRDKLTEIRWGLADFRRRFHRDAEGFWLPETAADEETLVALAREGVRFTILAPQQVENVNPSGGPLRFSAGGGRDLAVFVYDGALAHAAAFGPLLEDGTELSRRLSPSAGRRGSDRYLRVTSLALDGETFGHHHKFAEMALAVATRALQRSRRTRLENYASVLERNPPSGLLRLIEPSSWSCAHGVERWRSACSCGVDPAATHAWRRPLRATLNWLARELDALYDAEGPRLFSDPETARNSWGAVAALPDAERSAAARTLVSPDADPARGQRLLEAVRARLAMFSSCAWFFDEATGHETVLMLRQAAYAIDAFGADHIEAEFVARLEHVQSDDASKGNAALAYTTKVQPMRIPAAR